VAASGSVENDRHKGESDRRRCRRISGTNGVDATAV